jgi:hypothetical protein
LPLLAVKFTDGFLHGGTTQPSRSLVYAARPHFVFNVLFDTIYDKHDRRALRAMNFDRFALSHALPLPLLAGFRE